MYRGQKPRTLSGYCRPRLCRVSRHIRLSLSRFRRGIPHCAENETAIPLKALASILQGLLLPIRRVSRYFRRWFGGQKPFQILLHSKISAQKVSKPESAGQIAPMTLNSRNPPLFSAISRLQSYISNIVSPCSRGADFTKNRPRAILRNTAARGAVRESRDTPRRANAREKRDGRNR